jgi:hypothetical protein
MDRIGTSLLPVLEGIGRNIDLWGVWDLQDQYDFLDEDADEKAFESDAQALKMDFEAAIKKFRKLRGIEEYNG